MQTKGRIAQLLPYFSPAPSIRKKRGRIASRCRPFQYLCVAPGRKTAYADITANKRGE